MKTRSVMAAGVVTLFAMPLSAQAQGIGDGARQGARTGYYAAGPVGGVVGGAVGGVTGGVVGASKACWGYTSTDTIIITTTTTTTAGSEWSGNITADFPRKYSRNLCDQYGHGARTYQRYFSGRF